MDLSVSEQLTRCTVRISVDTHGGGRGTGTGFYFRFADDGKRHVPAIITNKHVVAGAVRGRFSLSRIDDTGNPRSPKHREFVFEGFEEMWVPHPDADVDLCAMPLAPAIEDARRLNFPTAAVQLDVSLLPTETELADLTALEDILMVGYPNGIWDEHNNMPVLRRGITATHPNLDWNGRPEFLIDAACFPGSSGSPVFLFNPTGYTTRAGGMVMGSRTKLLGVLYAGPQYTAEGEIRIVAVPTQERVVALTTIPNNLGIVIKAERLRVFEEIFRGALSAARQWR